MEVLDVERIETQDYLDKYGYNTTKLTYPEILPKSYNMTIYVKNQKGLSILYKLISEAYTELFYEKPRIKKSSLEKHRENLLICPGSHSNELTQAILNGEDEEKILKIANFYDFLIINSSYSNTEYLEACNKVRELGEKINKPVLIIGNVSHIDSLDKKLNQIAVDYDLTTDTYELENPEKSLNMHKSKFSEDEEEYGGDFKSIEEMLEKYSFLGKDKAYELVVKNPNLICDLIEEIELFPHSEKLTEIDNADLKLKEFAYDKLREIYGESLPPIVEKHIELELNLCAKDGYSSIFLIGKEIAQLNISKGYSIIVDDSFSALLLGKICGLTELSSLPPHYICSNCKHSEFISDNKYIFGYDLPNKKCPICNEELKKDGYRTTPPTIANSDGLEEPNLKISVVKEQMVETIEHLKNYITENLGVNHIVSSGNIEKVDAFSFFRNLSKDDIEKLGVENDINTKRELSGKKIGRILSSDRISSYEEFLLIPKDMEIYDITPIEKTKNNYGLPITHMDNYKHSNILVSFLENGMVTLLKKLEDSTYVYLEDIDLADPLVLSLFSSTDALNMDTNIFNNNNGLLGISYFANSSVNSSLIQFEKKILSEVKINSFLDLIKAVAATYFAKDEDELINIIKSNDGDLSDIIILSEDIYWNLVDKGVDEDIAYDTMLYLSAMQFGKGTYKNRLDDERKQTLKGYELSDEYINILDNFVSPMEIHKYAAEIINYIRLAWYKLYYPLEFYSESFDYYYKFTNNYPVAENLSQIRKQLEVDREFIELQNENIKMIYELSLEMHARGYQFDEMNRL